MRPFGPKPADHPSVGIPCPICKRPFKAGDYTTLVATVPADAEELAKMRAGRAYNSRAEEVCWDHAEAIAFMTGEKLTGQERVPGKTQKTQTQKTQTQKTQREEADHAK